MAKLKRFLLGATLALCGPAMAHAQATITLKIADILPPGHYIARESVGFWMAELTKRAKGRIAFEYYPAGQLGKARDMLTLLRAGTVDMAYIAPGYIPEKFPLSGVVELPRMVTSSCAGTKAYWPMLNGGLLDRQEFAPNGIVPIMGFVAAPSQLQGHGTPHVPATDLHGLKVRGEGSAMELTIRSLGGVPIQIPGPDIRQALERGTIDAVIGLSPSAVTYDHVQFLSYVTTNANLSAPGLTYSMSATRWRSLPDDVKALIRTVSEEANTNFCTADDRLEAVSLKQMQARGMTAVTLSQTESAQLDAQVAQVRTEWVASMKQRGLPSQEAFDAFSAARR